MNRLQRHQSGKQDVQGAKLQKLRQEYEAISAERAHVQQQIDRNNELISQTEAKVRLLLYPSPNMQILALKQRQEAEETQLLADYARLSQALESYKQEWLSV